MGSARISPLGMGEGGGLTLKTRRTPHVLSCQIWWFYVKGCVHKHKGTQKNWGSLGHRFLAVGACMADPLQIGLRSILPTCKR